MKNTKGVIYILTNPSFPQYVKIGYADDIKTRLAQLNRSECTPFAFRIYATYEVDARLTDMKLHSIIDKLNPNLRAIDNVDGKKRIREFYAITAEDAFAIFEAMAEIHGTQNRLNKFTATEEQKAEEKIAADIEEERKERLTPFSFSIVNIAVGEALEFCCAGNSNSGKMCTVIDDKHVEFNGKVWSLSALAAELSEAKYSVAGPRYFKYNGEWLNEIRRRLGV